MLSRMSRSDLKDLVSGPIRACLNDLHGPDPLVFTSEAFMHSNAMSTAVVSSPTLLHSAEARKITERVCYFTLLFSKNIKINKKKH